jgi:hypothetical protein
MPHSRKVRVTPGFLTVQLVGNEKTFRDLNPFYIQKNVDCKLSEKQHLIG